MPFCNAEGWSVFSTQRDMDFSMCFQDSVLTLIPSVTLLIVLAPRIHMVAGKGRLQGVGLSVPFLAKMAAILAAAGVQIGLLVHILRHDNYGSSSIASTVLYLVALLGASGLHYLEHFNMPNVSATLLLFWLFTGLISIFPTRSWIEDAPNGLGDSAPLLKLIFTILAFVMFALENVPKRNHASLARLVTPKPIGDTTAAQQSNPSPEPRANFFARISFFWLVPLLWIGRTKSLRMDDIYNLHPKLLSYPLYLTTKAKMDADEAAVETAIKAEGEAESEGIEVSTLQQKRGKINLVATLFHTVGYGFLTAIVPRIFYIAALYIRPILFSGLIAFIDSYSSVAIGLGKTPQEPWIGYGLLIAVMAGGLLAAVFNAQFLNINFVAGLKARSVFVSLIYRKALRLSSTSKQEGIGAIVNHMSSDVDQVIRFFELFHYFWSAIIEIAVAIGLLYREVKYATFTPFGVISVTLLVSQYCATRFGPAMEAMMMQSDNRMKLVNELVNHIKSIKLYVWEPYFINQISEVRRKQISNLRRFFAWITVMLTFMNMIAPSSIFATLTVYSAISSPGEPLDIRRIFTTITLISMIEGPINMLTESLNAIVTGKVAFDRLSKFLNSEEIDSENVIRDDSTLSPKFAYEINDGTFGWYSPEAIQISLERQKKEAEEKVKDAAKAAAKDTKSMKNKKEATEKNTESTSEQSTVHEDEEVKKEENKEGATPENMGAVLHDINLKVKHGSLTAVVGRVGSGKSSLVGALLGEMYRYSGTVAARGSIAYVAQTAWILNDTVRNNILFGRPYNKERYLNTVRSCALIPDFKMLVNGDKTVIGEKGINLSGGQKQRISIARAVYADADIYILDDPLSAVDAHVDHHIFDQAITSILGHKTRILITNGVNHLSAVDQIVVVRDGRISQDGKYDDLIRDEQSDLFRLIQESQVVSNKEKEAESEDETTGDEESNSSETEELMVNPSTDSRDGTVRPAGPVKRPTYRRGKSSKAHDDDYEIDENNEIDEEVQKEGRVGWAVYKFYFRHMGTAQIAIFLVIAAIFLVAEMMSSIWQQRWGEDNARIDGAQHTTNYWILGYMGLILTSAVVLAFCIGFTMCIMAPKASVKLHQLLLMPLVRSPMSFFDTTSSGKIVNRFSHDIHEVDFELPLALLNFIFIVMGMIVIYAFSIAASPYFAIIMIPIGYIYYLLGGFYLVSSREIKRLDSAARSPMYAHFNETLAGLATIRAYSDGNRFNISATSLLDRSQQTSYIANASARWLQLMMEMVSLVVLLSVGLLAITQRSSSGNSIFPIVLSRIGDLTTTMSRFLQMVCTLENTIVSVERLREYSELAPEARDVIPDSETDPAWPQQGAITFDNYSTRYREGLDLVLKNLTLTVKAGERVGVVGRTGAGKSSITMALFRIIEAAEGSISVDGVEISTLGLAELRSRITIIPQDPFLFGGTIRANLDPFGKYSDADLWAALESASLKAYVASQAEGLSSTIDNGGENMSLGQRQLMSLARAMLNKTNTRVLCLDEATAAIDIETDNAIQRALRRKFKSCTVLTIAHRINTIMDSDKILVLDHGRVAEYDSPKNLLQKPEGIFYSLAAKSGNA
ncbi:hypothetical protein BG004_007885 [Podila humilis]|nr:hypothetical protein BG004_007885 [Podila humilis]